MLLRADVHHKEYLIHTYYILVLILYFVVEIDEKSSRNSGL